MVIGMDEQLKTYTISGSRQVFPGKPSLNGADGAMQELRGHITQVRLALQFYGQPDLGDSVQDEYKLHCVGTIKDGLEDKTISSNQNDSEDPIISSYLSVEAAADQAKQVFNGKYVVKEYEVSSTYNITREQLEAIGNMGLQDIPEATPANARQEP